MTACDGAGVCNIAPKSVYFFWKGGIEGEMPAQRVATLAFFVEARSDASLRFACRAKVKPTVERAYGLDEAAEALSD